MIEHKKSLIEFRLIEANDSLKEATVLLQSGMSFRSVMNLLYYAMFYAVLSLLQDKAIGTSKHSGAIALFDREYVKTGDFTKEMSKALHRAFQLRQIGDYMEETIVTLEDIEEIRPLAEQFVTNVENFFSGNNTPDSR
ncbi:MAG: HEPN domain-containing protein [Proteobacteria bacterium]|nr:HEPN domain-containing protein [Desulfobulbaceae bacterium]MBU4151628.1 HEPN domain-containing protein [Pseudomonadota bacterium]